MPENGDEDAKASCGSCLFFVRHEYDNLDVISDYGTCVRYPPRAISETRSLFPIVTQECFCGEYQPDNLDAEM